MSKPSIAVITGSGITLGNGTEPRVGFHMIPGLAAPSVAGHAGNIFETDIEGVRVLVMSGRVHFYEGKGASAVLAPIHWLHHHGIRNIVFTNAVGGLDDRLHVGDVVLVSDVIRPPGWIGVGPIHGLDCSWRSRTQKNALHRGLILRDGVYVQVLGPQYETRSEIRLYRRMGAHVIGMSTAIEAMEASALGIKVVVLSLVTNELREHGASMVNHDDVLKAAREGAGNMTAAIHASIFAVCD